MDINPLDALIAEGAALVDGTVVGTNADWIALAKRQHAALKAARDECEANNSDDSTYACGRLDASDEIYAAMSTAAEVPHGK